MDSFMEETGIRSFVGSLQYGSLPQVVFFCINPFFFIERLEFFFNACVFQNIISNQRPWCLCTAT